MTAFALGKWGNSYGIRIPMILLKQLSIEPGDFLELEPDLPGHRLILKPAAKRKGWREAFNQNSAIKETTPMSFANQFDENEWIW